MNKISFKLGLFFFAFILLIEFVLFYFLYTGLVNTRITEELSELQARGNSHRNVLEKHYDSATISHVSLMESEAETDVVIVNADGNLIETSNSLTASMQNLLQEQLEQIPDKGLIIEDRWRTESVISTVSPIRLDDESKVEGYVYMFKSTTSIHEMIARLKNHFFLIGGLAFVFTVISIFFLSKALTIPLIRMKEATEKLSKGDFSVSLNVKGNDELAELAGSIQTLARELNHLKVERKEFLASISHELRTPLTYVKGYADIAKREGVLPEEREKYLAIIVEEADHLSRLVKDLFELAKMDHHEFVITTEKVELCMFIKGVIGKVKSSFMEKNMKLEYICKDTYHVMIDPSRFEQVLINLLDNARKYSPADSTVQIIAEQQRDRIKLSIIDKGMGIPKEDLPYVFDRFYRVDKSRSRESGGTGLGLAIVKEIVEAHGGTIEIHSDLGKGTTISIRLKRG